MNDTNKDFNMGLEIVYRLLCIPLFLLIGLYWAGYMWTPYFSYAIYNAYSIYTDNYFFSSYDGTLNSFIKDVLVGGVVACSVWLLILKIVTFAYSWAILSPIKLRLNKEVKSTRHKKAHMLIEGLILAIILATPVIIAHYRYDFFDLLPHAPLTSSSSTATTSVDPKVSGLDKEIKRMSAVTVDKIRMASTKGLEALLLVETIRAYPLIKNSEEIALQGMLLQQEMAEKSQEADAAFNEFRTQVRKSKEDKYMAYHQAVARYKCLCNDSLKLWMLALNARDLTDEEGKEARKKMDVECKAIRNLTNKEGSEACKKMDITCKTINDLLDREGGNTREQMNVACRAIRESCFESIKSGFYISQKYQIAD